MSKNPLAIIILAAGKGTRMKSDLPKVMHKVAHLPMINWVINTAQSLNPEKIIVVTGPDMPDLEAACMPHETVVQQERNGTGGAVKVALSKLKGFKGDVLVLLGDTPLITQETLQDLIKARQSDAKTGLSVLGAYMDDPSGYGRLVTGDEDILERIVEHKDASDKEREINIVNIGAFCIDGGKLENLVEQIGNDNAQGEYYITDLPEIAAKEGIITRVHVCYDEEEVQGCNSRIDLAEIENAAQWRMREAVLESGVTMHDPASVYFAHDTKIGKDVTIEPHVVFAPGVNVAEGVYIKAFSHFEGANIGKNVDVGPFARLRPGAEIGEGVRIGNFVEVKKSKIGKRSKINHLAYVGDTQMGEDVNFSAGAITVNYDGFDKHQTVIGDNVMVGSNANLVAPINVGDGAFIAAGSTVNKDVPADALSIARDAPKTYEGWAAKYRKRKMKNKEGKK